MTLSEDVVRKASRGPAAELIARDRKAHRGCLRLARAYLQQGAFDEAETVLRSGLDRHPDDIELMTRLAAVACKAGNWGEAVSRCQAVLDTHGGEAPAAVYLHLAQAHRKLGRGDEAEAALRTGLVRHPGDLHLMTSFADQARMAGDWGEAVSRYRAVLDIHRDTAPARLYKLLAMGHRALWADDEAEAVIRRGLDRHPGHLELMTSFAELACNATQWKAAVSRYREVLDTHGDKAPPSVYGRLATVHQKDLALDDAATVLRIGLERFPADPMLMSMFAESAFEARDWSKAVKRYEAILNTQGDEAPANVYLRLAQSRHLMGDADGAHAALDRGLALYPASVSLQTQCPWRQISLKRVAKTAKPHPFMRLTVDETFALETECLTRLGRTAAPQAHFPRLVSSNSRTREIVTDFKGYSLECLTHSHVRLDVPHLDQQVARIMRTLEANNVVHLDISASNVVVDEAGTIGIIDFGLSVLDDSPVNEVLATILETFKRAGGYAYQGRCMRKMVQSTCNR